jgi:hypothetical protein
MANHRTDQPTGRLSAAALITLAAVLAIGAVCLALVLTGHPDDAQGVLGFSVLVGAILATTRRKWL